MAFFHGINIGINIYIYMYIYIYYDECVFNDDIMWVIVNHPPVISIFVGGMVTIPSHGWFMTLLYPH